VATFAFRAVDVAGTPSRGEAEAASKAAVTEQLRQRGLIVLDVSEKREALKLESIFQRFKSVNLRALAVFSRQFATLIAAGMPMLRSLYTLEDQSDDQMLTKAIIGVRENVEAGSSLSAAMETQPGVFDPLYRSMVNAGEGSGRLEDALDRIAYQLEKLDALRRQVKSAMTYPAVVFGLAMVVMISVVAFIVPVFVGIFEEITAESGESGELPFMTQITVGVSDAITGKWYVLIPAIALAAYAFTRWKKTDRGRLQWDKLKLRLPAHIGDVVQKVALARWSRTFAGTVASGVPILQAIEISGQTAGNAVVNEAMAAGLPVLVSRRCGCAYDLVREGVNGYTFDPYNVDELSDLMLRVARMPDTELIAMGAASQRLIQPWGPDAFAQGLLNAVRAAERNREHAVGSTEETDPDQFLHGTPASDRPKFPVARRTGIAN
jgi:type IV pilus assembly protein PilC